MPCCEKFSLCHLFGGKKTEKRKNHIHGLLSEKLPVFWIIGPPKSGKTTVAHFLSDCSNFRLINAGLMQLEEYQEGIEKHDVVTQVKMEIANTYKFCQGYIFHDFPENMRDCRRFEKKVCKPNLVIYIAFSLDAFLGRTIALNPLTDLNKARIEYVEKQRHAKRIYRRYKRRKSAIKIFSQFPIQEILVKLLESLETELGYKFHQIVKINL